MTLVERLRGLAQRVPTPLVDPVVFEAADRIEDWQDAGERYQKAIEQLEAALSGMLAYFVDGKDPSEDQLRDPDFWEGSYKSAPSQEYLDYWKVVDGARAALDPTYTANSTFTREEADDFHRATGHDPDKFKDLTPIGNRLRSNRNRRSTT